MIPPRAAGMLRGVRRLMARLPSLSMARVPDAPAQPVRDRWPGDPARGAAILRGELERGGHRTAFKPGLFGESKALPALRELAHSFVWLRDLRALGTDAARMRARALVSDWIATPVLDPVCERPDVAGARIAAWLGHYDFFAASADDVFRQKLMGRLLADARGLSAAMPPEQVDARAFTALRGLIAAAVALPEHDGFLHRALRVLPQEIERQVFADGCHCERSPAQLLAVLQDLTDISALLKAGQAVQPPALGLAIDRIAPALRALRHPDGGLSLFNGTRETDLALIELALSQAGRATRGPSAMNQGGFHRLAAGKSVLIVDCGPPPPERLDRFSHAGTFAFELSVGKDRLIVNCGAIPYASGEWHDATRSTAAHSTLVIADTNSSELRPDGLGRRPEKVTVTRQGSEEGAHWLDLDHDGYLKPFGARHLRRLFMSDKGEDIRGEDSVIAATPQPFTIRFHLHPAVTASLKTDGEGVLMRLPSGQGWEFRASGALISLEESIYLGGTEPRRSEQIVLTVSHEDDQHVKWTISKGGPRVS